MTFFRKIGKTLLSDMWPGSCFCAANLRDSIELAQYFRGVTGHMFCFSSAKNAAKEAGHTENWSAL